MFEQLNELEYRARSGRKYVLYFLKFWQSEDNGDYVVKYQIRAQERDIVWYGRMSRERALGDIGIEPRVLKETPPDTLEKMIKQHLQSVLVHVIKKGLDKGYEEPNAEFVFYCDQPITRRTWQG
jgi:hypothetical protein